LPTSFGPFSPLFDSGNYLALLNLGASSERAIDEVSRALREETAPVSFNSFMSDGGWRPHLVGATACLLDRDGTLDRLQLWSAADAGSWVSPQLVVAAMFSDAEFVSRARERLQNFGQVRSAPSAPPEDQPQPVSVAAERTWVHRKLARITSWRTWRPTREVSSLVRHVVHGPGTRATRNAKLVASLLAVCHRIPTLAASETAWRGQPEVKQLLVQDVDNSEELALRWMSAVEQLFQKRGTPLQLPSA
jgi:hypothetical protein